MRRALAGATVVGTVMLGVLWASRTPTLALVRLKLALDAGDLATVERAVDARALTRAALPPGIDPSQAATIGTLRPVLGVELEREIERLVDGALRVSWPELCASVADLQRTGPVARFRFRDVFQVRMRQDGGGWRIVAIERDGDPLLRARAPSSSSPVSQAAAPVAPDPPARVAERFTPMVDGAGTPAQDESAAEREHPRPRPFVRQIEGRTWTIQVTATTDAVEAAHERSWLVGQGEPAFVLQAQVGRETWHRVLVGRYATRPEAERGITRLQALARPFPAAP